jgi:predicted transcriptional regulator
LPVGGNRKERRQSLPHEGVAMAGEKMVTLGAAPVIVRLHRQRVHGKAGLRVAACGRSQSKVLHCNPYTEVKNMTTTLSMRVPAKLAQQLGQIAKAAGRSRTFIVVQAVKDFVEREAWQIAETQQALQEADAGDFATDAEMAALDTKWAYNAD